VAEHVGLVLRLRKGHRDVGGNSVPLGQSNQIWRCTQGGSEAIQAPRRLHGEPACREPLRERPFREPLRERPFRT
jgi:hypothetical protein